jgi:hypothetical protein
MRFLEALRILDTIEPIYDPESIPEMRRYIADIADATGLIYCGESPLPPRRYTTEEWARESEAADSSRLIDDTLTAQAQFRIEGISDRLPLLANLASCLSGNISRQFASLLLAHSDRYDFIAPPLEFLKNDKVGFRGTAVFGNNVVRSVAVSAALFEFACGTGRISLDELPLEVQGKRMFGFLKDTLHHLIVETDNV